MAALTEEQTLIKDQATAWVTEQAPVNNFREVRDSGAALRYNVTTWQSMVEMGWTGILVPEQYGGSELGYLTFGLILEQMGRQLTASPLLASALVGASAITLGGSDAQKQALLPKVVDGSVILSLAVDEGAHHAPARAALRAEAAGDGYRLSGSKRWVIEGMAATHLVVAARTSGSPGEEAGITLLVVPADSAGVSRTDLSTVDSRGYADVVFDNVELGADAVLGEIDGGFALLDAVLDRGRAGLAAEMLGVSSQSFDMTLEYLKTRVQFGQVIGSFQALGHRAAQAFTQMELTRSCVEGALQGLDAGADDAASLCSLSKCKAGAFVRHMSNELIQIHGGIGMTDEFDAGLFLKRARTLEATWGGQGFHRDRYATLLGY